MKKLIALTVLTGLAAGLSACGGGSGGSKTVVVTPPEPGATAKYGAKFDAAFKADPNADPVTVAPGDVVAVDPTAEPTAL